MNSAADWYAEQEYRERCGMPHEGASMPKQKISNGDRIRQMTDEELVDILSCNQCVYQGMPECEPNDCKYGVLAWLKQEVDQNE